MGNAFILRCRGMANAREMHESCLESVWGMTKKFPVYQPIIYASEASFCSRVDSPIPF